VFCSLPHLLSADSVHLHLLFYTPSPGFSWSSFCSFPRRSLGIADGSILRILLMQRHPLFFGQVYSVFKSCCAIASSAFSAGFSMFFGFSLCHLYLLFPGLGISFCSGLSLSLIMLSLSFPWSVLYDLVPCPMFLLPLFESQENFSSGSNLSSGSTETSSRAWNSHKNLWPLLSMLPHRSFHVILRDLHGRFERER